MNKFYILLVLMLGWFNVCGAQTLLNEDFENDDTTSYNPNIASGWTTVDSYVGNVAKYRWNNYYASSGTISGKHCAMCDAPLFSSSTEGKGPREEILVTPELNLDSTYQLSFDWEAAAYYVFTNKCYDFQVRVIEGTDTTTIWSFTNETQVRNSGVTKYPWTTWTVYNSKIDLSPYQGKKIKIAFVYKMLATEANILYLDNVSVKAHAPETSPIANLSTKMYNFGAMYIGEKHYSTKITLKNTGLNGLKVTDIVLPNNVTTTLDKDKVDLAKNETVDFQVAYSASFTSPTDANVVIKTNGGDLTLRVLATKTAVPDGYTLETFEENDFPPAGWTNVNWGRTGTAIEGDHSAYTTGSLSDQYLTTPRLDLSKEDSTKFTFTYYNSFTSEEGDTYPNNDIKVELSTDGGKTWTQQWMTDYTKTDNLETVTVNLKGNKSDNCYVRFHGTAVSSDDSGAYEFSDFYLDNVLVPNLYGIDGVPFATQLISPADSAINLYNHDIVLKWKEAQFATGYKIYIGKTDAANDVVNGVDLGNATTYTLADADYATAYKWKVVPYNKVGEATGIKTWHFATISDQTITEFPYSEGFEETTFPPLGWNNVTKNYAKWSANSIEPFDGKISALASSRSVGDTTILTTPDIVLPANSDLQLAFWWGNDVAVSLKKDNTTIKQNPTTSLDGWDAGFCEIKVDGKWQQLTYISDPNEDNRYWVRERFDLKPYAGKKVALRWIYTSYNYNKSSGVSLDNITIGPKNGSAAFNVDAWNAGKVNFKDSLTSDTIALVNFGSTDLTVSKVAFSTPNFETTLKQGDAINVNGSQILKVTFKALETNAAVLDTLKVTLSDNKVVSLPVSGTALASDIFYYGFEGDTPGKAPKGFVTIDVDGLPTPTFYFMKYPLYGQPFAFPVENNKQWNNVFDCASGRQALVCCTPSTSGSTADDWVVCDSLKATANSTFSFDARNWESVTSILPDTTPTLYVMVSTKSQTDRTTFEQVGDKIQLPLYDNKAWGHYTYDLSKYAGKQIYVALRHTVTDGLASFYDNFEFDHVSRDNSGVNDINVDNVDLSKADVTVYALNGAVIAHGIGATKNLDNGIYLVKINGATGVNSVKKYVVNNK
jgi:hypothetical protein